MDEGTFAYGEDLSAYANGGSSEPVRDVNHAHDTAISRAVDLLRAGEAIVFPTDTVYGIGVAVADSTDPGLLFEIKKRPREKAIPWLVHDVSALERFGRDVSGYCLEMADSLWPGALTIVVEAGDAVPHAFRGEGSTIALRAPDHSIPLELMRRLDSPLATTSANLSGRPAVDNVEDLDPEVTSLVPMVIDGGRIGNDGAAGGRPSTVVSCVGPEPRILREGDVTLEQIMRFVR